MTPEIIDELLETNEEEDENEEVQEGEE